MKRISGSSARPFEPRISVLTPSIPGRERFLDECERTVLTQTYRGWEHLGLVDERLEGCSRTMNRLAAEARGDWLLPLADDDLLLPGCLAALLAASLNADVVYAPPLVTGNEDRWWFFQSPPAIPSFALIRRSLWVELGGYDETVIREEDRRLWEKAVAAGARFVRVDEPCWIYRQHPGNKSFAQAA